MNADSAIPLIDFDQFLNGSTDRREQVASAIDAAFRSVGFLYVSNHGIDQDKVDECFQWSKRFFALSESKKNLIRRPPDKSIYRGYVGVGREKVRERVCIKESFDTGNPDEDEQTNLWPPEELLPGFREFMEMFYQECSKLVRQLLDALSIALHLAPADSLAQFHEASLFAMSLLYYPALPTKDLLSGAHTRIPAHSDFGTLTLLFQDDVGGLEIAEPGSANTETSAGFEKEGRFRRVEPKPGTVVVNVGYLLMRWSNGRWKNTVHRVVEPPNSTIGGDEMTPARYSVPFFASPDPATVVEALPGCWSEEVPRRWKAISAGDYLRRKRQAVYV
ncbi:hypothetical protein HO173_006161 [Letharia columbiana]|uniref:Fe2OG dioxygenase domain-containing protein n=1 Tax=Letharia columbiana TaxID=112416 RepID=A0A8H6FVI8_9LECA|nr:uncharacterized protein HO173_006161 [Letharia columbiana]KAF6235478.1 hypothetical protein HO173_006161 [Letharia columbiana]